MKKLFADLWVFIDECMLFSKPSVAYGPIPNWWFGAIAWGNVLLLIYSLIKISIK